MATPYEKTVQMGVHPVGPVIRASLALSIVATLIGLSLWIVLPFIGAVAWGAIIAISIYSLHLRLSARLGARRKLSAVILGIFLTLVVFTPVVMLFLSIGEHANQAAEALTDIKDFTLPALPAWIGELPLIGRRIAKLWLQVQADTAGAIDSVRPQLRDAVLWLLTRVVSSGVTVVEAALAIVSAVIFLITGPRLKAFFTLLFARLGDHESALHVGAIERTVHAVTQGILGTAFIQALLVWIGYGLAGAPFPIVLAFLAFILCSIQLGVMLIGLPAAAWMMWGLGETEAAIFVLGWTIFVNVIDNVIKPILIGRDFPVPLWVGFVGVIGGLLSMGLLGLFIGPIVLSISYLLLMNWVRG